MSKEKNEDIKDDIHSESETDELEESNEVSDEERIAELQDTILRLRAELDNSQKRSVAEVEKAHKYGVERLLLELLPVVDNLEKALTIENNDSEKFIEGVNMTLKRLKNSLENEGVVKIEAKGEKFDPSFMEAIATIPSPNGEEEGMVIEIIEQGYMFHDRILRPVKVIVSEN